MLPGKAHTQLRCPAPGLMIEPCSEAIWKTFSDFSAEAGEVIQMTVATSWPIDSLLVAVLPI